MQPADGSANAVVVATDTNPIREGVVTPDGASIVYRVDTPDSNRDIHYPVVIFGCLCHRRLNANEGAHAVEVLPPNGSNDGRMPPCLRGRHSKPALRSDQGDSKPSAKMRSLPSLAAEKS